MQKLIEQRIKETGVQSPDELVQMALQTLRQVSGADLETLDADTQAAIEEGLAQIGRGETRHLSEVRDEIRSRFIGKQ